jgi:hypothetical protein
MTRKQRRGQRLLPAQEENRLELPIAIPLLPPIPLALRIPIPRLIALLILSLHYRVTRLVTVTLLLNLMLLLHLSGIPIP